MHGFYIVTENVGVLVLLLLYNFVGLNVQELVRVNLYLF